MENIQPNDIGLDNKSKVKKGNSKTARLLIISAAVIAVLTLVACGVFYYLNNYVLFPRADKALANALEAKFDFGTKFDPTDMIKQGAIELSAEDAEISGEHFDSLQASFAYSKKGVKATLAADEERINAVLTKKGVAVSSDNVNNGAYYGTSFSDLSEKLEASFLNPENESEYALTKEKYKQLTDFVSSLEDTKENKGESAKDAIVVLDAIKTAFEKSPLYEKEKSYNGIDIDGELRSARCITYSLDHNKLIGFLDELAAVFEEPSEELEGAVSRLLEGGMISSSVEDSLGIELKNCEDVSELISDLSRLIDIFLGKTKWQAKLVCAYVKDAFSAITLDVSYKDKSFSAVLDFGIDPKKDRAMSLRIMTEPSGAVESKEFLFRYSVEENKDNTVISASYSVTEDIQEDKYTENTYVAVMTLDRKNSKASLAVDSLIENGFRSNTDGISKTEERLLELSFDMEDKHSRLSLSIDMTDKENVKYAKNTGRYTVVFKRRIETVKLPKYTDILESEIAEADAVVYDFIEQSKRISDVVSLIYPMDE